MLCAICGKEMDETELGKQYCYHCEKKWFDDDAKTDKTIDLSHRLNNHNLFISKEDEEND